ncbi:unnamed protein product [Absidia cylindrospora]
MSTPTTIANATEFNQLRAQNEQLWKIIERQRTMIQDLQKENLQLAAERDGLQDNVNTFERVQKQRASILFTPDTLKAMTQSTTTTIDDEPSRMPPPRSPYRSNSDKPESQFAHKEQLLRQQGKHINFSLDTSDSTTTNMTSTTLQQQQQQQQHTPLSPRNVILDKDHQQAQKVQTNNIVASPSNTSERPPFVMPVPSVSSPITTNIPLDVASLSSSLSSTGSSYLRPNSPPDLAQRAVGNRTKRESHVFFSPPPASSMVTDAPTTSYLDIDHPLNNATTPSTDSTRTITGSSLPPPPPPPQHQYQHPQHMHTMSSVSTSTTMSSSSSLSSSSSTLSPGPFAGGITNIAVKVLGSNIRQNEKCREVISFIISVGKKPDEHNLEFEELWRVEKLYSHFLELDSKIKSAHRSVVNRLAKLPDKALFTTNAPSKVDRRKAALENYLQHIVSLPLDDISHLCEFLSTNVVDADVVYSRTGRKEGYLTKRGKNFGGWKTRYFVLNGSSLEYYESKDGNHLGTIRLVNAQIGRQTPGSSSTTTTDDHSNIYRHAFLIVEQKRTGSSHVARHILCADSDQDRDAWVDALFKNVSMDDGKQQPSNDGGIPPVMKKKPTKSMSSKSSSSSTHETDFDKWRPSVGQGGSDIGIALTGPPPNYGKVNESSESLPTKWPSALSPPPIIFDQRTSLDQPRSSHSVMSGTNQLTSTKGSNHSLQPGPYLARRSSMVNLLNTSHEEEVVLPQRAMSPSPAFGRDSDDLLGGDDMPEKKPKTKRMTFWGKKMFNSSSESLVVPSRPSPSSSSSSSTATNTPLDMSSSSTTAPTQSTSSGFRGFLSRPSHEHGRSHGNSKDMHHQTPQQPVFGVPLEESVRVSRVSDTYQLPSVVFRCLEYLDVKKAILEEGLYRLSGSNIMMKSLKQKFDIEGDINLLEAKEEYDVHAIAGLLKMWLRELPTSVLTREHRMDFLHVIDLLDRKDRVNELGRLVSLLPIVNYTLLRALIAHLIQVVQHSDVNKMTMRNVSIVFSPTLGIPGTVFNLLMSEFDYIFWTTEDGDAAPRMILDDENTVYEKPTKVVDTQDQTTTTTASTDPTTKNCDDDGGSTLKRRPTLQLLDGRSNRNSVNYRESAPDTIVELEKHQQYHGQQLMLDEIEDEVNDLALTDDDFSVLSDDKAQPQHQTAPTAITT